MLERLERKDQCRCVTASVVRCNRRATAEDMICDECRQYHPHNPIIVDDVEEIQDAQV